MRRSLVVEGIQLGATLVLTATGSDATHLWPIDETGMPTGEAPVPLSQAISLEGSMGIFSGLGRATLVDGRTAYDVDVLSGEVGSGASLWQPAGGADDHVVVACQAEVESPLLGCLSDGRPGGAP